MIETAAHISADGRCEYRPFDQLPIVWPTLAAFADAWLAERESGELGPVWSFLWHACAEPQPGVVAVVTALALKAAGNDELISEIGAGPLEDLIRQAGNNAALLADIEHAARQEPAVRAVLARVWLSSEVPAAVRQRLVPFGVTDLTT